MDKGLSRRDVMRTIGAGALAATVGACTSPASAQNGRAVPVTATGWSKDGEYVLPPLPYDYDALEPFLGETTLRTHHDKHHQGYVNGLNGTMDKMAEARKQMDFSRVKALSRALAFHGSGHIFHTIFWNSMRPGGTAVEGKLAQLARRDFGSVHAMKAQFAAASKAVEGSGWGVLAMEPIGGKLVVLQAEKHQNLTFWGCTPLLVCDVWEHAYYLDYKNNRGAFVDGFMEHANWKFAQVHLEAEMD